MPDLKQVARRIFQQTLAAIDIPATIRDRLDCNGSRILVNGDELDLAAYNRIIAIAIGKASVASARGLTEALPPGASVEGILVAPHELLESSGAAIPGFRAIGAGHPLPDDGSFRAGREILDLLRTCDERTLVFFLLSGGGSALVELPLDPALGLPELRELNRLLVGCGASIDEINSVRKHLSAVKGGRLAAAAPAAMKLTFGVSDVPTGRESALASGPTLPDPTTSAHACDVVARYALLHRLPAAIAAKFAPGGTIPETPKPGDPAFARSRFELLLSTHDLFHHAHMIAQSSGYVCECDNVTDDWPLAEAADYLLDELARLSQANPGRGVALLSSGEVRSPVTGDGIGGRNTAFVLDCVGKIAGKEIAVLSAGTDGQDGSSPAAGAVADGQTLERARAQGLDPAEYFRRSDSYNFFRLLGDAVVTGPTGNNLRDLRILLAAPRPTDRF